MDALAKRRTPPEVSADLTKRVKTSEPGGTLSGQEAIKARAAGAQIKASAEAQAPRQSIFRPAAPSGSAAIAGRPRQ